MDISDDVPGNKKAEKASAAPSIFQKLIDFFSGSGDPEAEKKKLLKAIAKEVSRSRYKFFKPKGEEALPGLARFFYEIYKNVAPAQIMLQNSENSGSLRQFMIDSSLSDQQIALIDSMSDAAIQERAKTMPIKDVQEYLKNTLVQVYSIFDTDKVKQIDDTYNILLAFMRFSNFDYYFLLKKFDAAVTERSFTYNPRFEAISGSYVNEDIKDFLELFNGLNLEADWKRLFEGLKTYRNLDVIGLEAWNKLVAAMREVRRSQILVQIVQLMDKDPAFNPITLVSNEKIVDAYLQKLKTQTDVCLQKLIQEKRNSKVDEIARFIFGTQAVSRMKNYAEKANVVFAKKMLGGFIYVQALNYLKAFLLDYFKKDIREIVDILLIRGKWTTNVSSQNLSESFHALMAVSDNLLVFDDSLADDGELGSKLRNVLMRAERDKEQMKYLRTLLKDVNMRAAGLISQAGGSFISMGRTIKSLLDDIERNPHELLLNWKEVDTAANGQIKAKLSEIYKKIYYFVQLMQFFVKEEAS